MNSLKFHTSQHSSPGFTSLVLAIAFTDGLLNEKEISNAIELATSTFVRSISESVASKSTDQRQGRVSIQAPQRDSLDEILEQVLRQGSHISTV